MPTFRIPPNWRELDRAGWTAEEDRRLRAALAQARWRARNPETERVRQRLGYWKRCRWRREGETRR